MTTAAWRIPLVYFAYAPYTLDDGWRWGRERGLHYGLRFAYDAGTVELLKMLGRNLRPLVPTRTQAVWWDGDNHCWAVAPECRGRVLEVLTAAGYAPECGPCPDDVLNFADAEATP